MVIMLKMHEKERFHDGDGVVGAGWGGWLQPESSSTSCLLISLVNIHKDIKKCTNHHSDIMLLLSCALAATPWSKRIDICLLYSHKNESITQ